MELLINEEEESQKHPWKMIYQNIRSLISENSRKKMDYLNDYVYENKIILMNFTETWLTEEIQEEATINGYNEFRGDRKETKQGGTAIYLHSKTQGELITSYSKNKCEMIAIKVKSLNLVNIVCYRPPHTKLNDFKPMIDKVKKIFNELERPDPTILWTGDFNFPFVQWKECRSGGCTWDFNPHINASKDEKDQFKYVMKLCGKFNLIQTVDEPTRGTNTLDLIFTNELDIFSNREVSHSALSDHYFIELTTTIKTENVSENENIKKSKGGLRQLNFFSNKVKWDEIKREILNINWGDLLKEKDTYECTTILNKMINEICFRYIPARGRNSGKRNIPKVRKKLLGRLKMIRRKLRKALDKERINELNERILETERLIVDARRAERIEKEIAIVNSLSKNPKLLFSYSKKENNRRKEIGPFEIDGEYVMKGSEICKLLVKEYKSQFTEATINNGIDPTEEMNNTDEDLTDIAFNKEDILKAIEKLKENSGPGPDEIPPIFLIKTSNEITAPLMIILRKSIDEGKIPNIYKMAHISPIHKGGKKSKLKPENYRPVSLTSHIMKIYERVIAKNMIRHLSTNKLFNKNQHGFVPGKSTQTQLLIYYEDIYESLLEGVRIDTVFLDFARAFDKVNHKILMKKVKNHKIKGKIAKWIEEFLSNRKFKVVANNSMSEEEDVTSGVPQGTVLAALLFIIMISDIDEKIKDAIVRCFADDTRVSKKIRNEEDRLKMQTDLEEIYKWANNNMMEFNINKFEQISHGETGGLEIQPYKNPAGEDIISENNVRDLGVICSNNLLFREHIESITMKSKIMSGMILRTFITRDRNIMLTLFNAYIKSRLEYCSIVWSPTTQGDINKIERIQKSFTSRIEGMEGKNYHERLKELKLYSLERRRERYLIIYAWEQIENIRENIQNLETRKTGRCRKIVQRAIPWARNGVKLKKLTRTKLYNSTKNKMAMLFNQLPAHIANISGVSTITFKKHLDGWLQTIPDQPRIDNYSALVERQSNSILHQATATLI